MPTLSLPRDESRCCPGDILFCGVCQAFRWVLIFQAVNLPPDTVRMTKSDKIGTFPRRTKDPTWQNRNALNSPQQTHNNLQKLCGSCMFLLQLRPFPYQLLSLAVPRTGRSFEEYWHTHTGKAGRPASASSLPRSSPVAPGVTRHDIPRRLHHDVGMCWNMLEYWV